MQRQCHSVKGEALADYFCRLNSHLIGTVAVLELSDADALRVVYGSFPPLVEPGLPN